MVLLHSSRTITVYNSTVERYQTQLNTGGVQEPLQHPQYVLCLVSGGWPASEFSRRNCQGDKTVILLPLS